MSTDKLKEKPAYWYFISRGECVLCGRSTEYRERRYDPRPTDPNKRCDFKQFACEEHFL
jgi:hypothetical protein